MGFITQLNIATTSDFGDQMIKYATLYGISKQTDLTPLYIKEYLNVSNGFPLGEPFSTPIPIISLEDNPDLTLYSIETEEVYDERIFNLDSKVNYNFLGSGHYKYFHSFRDEIIKLFTFKDEIMSFCLDYINQIKQEDEILVSIHFRRGSYLLDSSLNLSLNYYNEAIQTIKSLNPNKKIKYLLFSNDIKWVKENFIIENGIYIENLGNDEETNKFLSNINNIHHRLKMNTSGDRFKEMCLMSLCDHNIIANSCYSFMGAYLNQNKNKIVICPYNYLNHPELNKMVNGKYFPPEWVSLNVY